VVPNPKLPCSAKVKNKFNFSLALVFLVHFELLLALKEAQKEQKQVEL
jgi:hypothetical protein